MKKIFIQSLSVVVLLLGMASCDRNELDPQSIFIDAYVDTTTYTYQFDKWLEKHFTDPYNVEFIYKLDDNGTDASYNIVPVSIGKADTLAHLALYLWYDVYDKVVGEDFLPQYGPKKIKLIGSAMINAAQGTEKLGYAEGGIQITLLKINLMETNNIDQLNEYIFKTMHHEFSHILHQQKAYPKEFGQITPEDYNPSRWQDRTEKEALELGFVSPYGSSQTREDFVEVIANYIVKTDSDWQNMLTKAGPKGASIINQKWEICSQWLQEKWNIDLVALHQEVQKRQENLDWDMIMGLKFLEQK